MAALTIQEAYDGNVNVTYASCNSGGDTVAGGTRNGGWSLPLFLIVKNGHNATITVTVAGIGAFPILAGDDAVIPVHGGAIGMVRAITYSAVTSLTIAAVNLAPARVPA